MIDKVVPTFDEAVADIESGARVHLGGFVGAADWPSYLIAALARSGPRDLTVACCNMSGIGPDTLAGLSVEERRGFTGLSHAGPDHVTVALLVEQGQVRKGITTFTAAMRGTLKSAFQSMYEAGCIELELVSQGTLSERIRAARAGIPAFYTPVGVGSSWAAQEETREFDGTTCVLEHALHADFSLIRAAAANRYGNLAWEHPIELQRHDGRRRHGHHRRG
ncbi:MAG: CoA-transferase [Dehalococcoidia bacterium]|nr:CoA-transferase [Dehalococcoidia bacterium]